MEPDEMTKQIDNAFLYHRPSPEDTDKMRAIRGKFRELAHMINEMCPDGREKSSCMTRLEEAQFHANAGISRQNPVLGD